MRQNKTIFFTFATLLTAIILYWFFSVLIIDRGEYSTIKKGMINADNNLKKLSNERANYTSIKEARKIQVLNFDTLKVHIPLKENAKGADSYIGTLDIIHQLADDNNISINVFKPILINTFPKIDVEDKQLDQSIERYWLEMECNGDFISIGKFFEELQNQEKIINLLKFNIETEYRSTGGLFCEVILNTYIIVEDN